MSTSRQATDRRSMPAGLPIFIPHGYSAEQPQSVMIVSEMITIDREMAPKDIAQLVTALLASIERGELEASTKEIEFLRSVRDLLEPQPA